MQNPFSSEVRTVWQYSCSLVIIRYVVCGMTHPIFPSSWFLDLTPSLIFFSTFFYIPNIPAFLALPTYQICKLSSVFISFPIVPKSYLLAPSTLPSYSSTYCVDKILTLVQSCCHSLPRTQAAKFEKEAHSHADRCLLHLDWTFRTAVWCPGLDPGTERGHCWQNW